VSAGQEPATSWRGEVGLRPLYPKLRVGRRARDGPSDDEVASHQRARLHGAMVRAIATDGYAATTVRQLSALAGVSTRTLYDLFADGKRECMLSAYDAAMRRMARRVALAYVSEDHWERRLARALDAFACEVRDQPAAARLVLVEVFAVGPGALERMERAHRLFEGMVNLSFSQTAGGTPPPLVVKGVVAGVARVARARLLDGRAAELPALTEELLEWVQSYRSPVAGMVQRLEGAGGPVAPPSAGGDERGDERGRILDAAVGLAAQDGYTRLSPARIAAAAGVSRRRFHVHFEDVQGCFNAALERLTNRALAYAVPAGAHGRDWPGGLHRALCALCGLLAGNPRFARLAFVEVFAPGPDGVRLRSHVMGEIAKRLRASAPAWQRPSELAAEASVGAVWGILYHHVAHGASDRLPDIAPQLSFMVLAPVLGAQAAAKAIRAEHARMHGAPVVA
jgi:AcrR family transcriptional regulator